MKLELKKKISEELANFIKRNTAVQERLDALTETAVSSTETVNRILRREQSITQSNRKVIVNLTRIAIRNSMQNELQERHQRESILADSEMSEEEFLNELQAYGS